MTVAELFKCAGLTPNGPVKWLEQVRDCNPGVYTVARVDSAMAACSPEDVTYLPPDEQARWIDDQPVVYIGRTKRQLAVRIQEFYCHRLGERRPHSGGQAVKRLRCDLWVYWSPTEGDPAVAEDAMLDAFQSRTGGRLPFANRRR